MSELYTSSRLRVLRECLRKHYYRYTLGIQAPATESMQFGTVGHRALEAYYRAWQECVPSIIATWPQDSTARLSAALAEIDSAVELEPTERAKLRTLVRAYDARWGAEDWEILAVEVEFRYLLGDHEIGGKIDAIIRDHKDDRVYVVEHKTTGSDASIGGSYWEKLTIDTQISIYIDGAAILGYEVSGCIYDVLKRPAHERKLATPAASREYTKGKGCKRCGGSGGGKTGIVQGKGYYVVSFVEVVEVPCPECAGTGWLKGADGQPQAPRLYANQRDTDETLEDFETRVVDAMAEDPDAYLMRGVIVRLEDELPAMRQDLIEQISVEQTGMTPRNPEACSRFGSLCHYFDACSGRADITDESRFPRSRAHPELDIAA